MAKPKSKSKPKPKRAMAKPKSKSKSKPKRAMATRSQRRLTLAPTEEERVRWGDTCPREQNCKAHPSKFAAVVYTKARLPSETRRQLLAEFKRLGAMNTAGDDRHKHTRLCRDGLVNSDYLREALRGADHVAVGRYNKKVTAVVFAVDEPADECVYLDVACAYTCPARCGSVLMDFFLEYARHTLGRRIARLTATAKARPLWARLGFKEAPVVRDADGTYRHTKTQVKAYYGDRGRRDPDSGTLYHMTRIL
jgi:hypothetical protein